MFTLTSKQETRKRMVGVWARMEGRDAAPCAQRRVVDLRAQVHPQLLLDPHLTSSPLSPSSTGWNNQAYNSSPAMSQPRPGSVTPTGGAPSYPPRSASTGAATRSAHRPLSSNSNSGSSFVNSPTSPAAVQGNVNGTSPQATRRTSAASSAAPTTPGAGQINRVTYKVSRPTTPA